MNSKLNHPSTSDIKKVLKLDIKKLPSFPQVATKLLEVSKDETASLTDLAKIVETDPGISVRVLEIVNSAMYGLGRKITALSEAVVFLGLDEIKKLAIGMTVFEKMFKTGKDGKKSTYAYKKTVKLKPLKMESSINKSVKINGKWYKEGDRVTILKNPELAAPKISAEFK